MTTKTKYLAVGVASATLLGAGLLTHGGLAKAATQPQSLVAEIAAKFNLNQTDVQSVFDTHKQEMQTYRQQRETERLDQAVTDGKITSAQKDLIVAKQQEIQQKMDEIRNMTDQTARQTAMQQLRTDLETWATDNNIDPTYLRRGGKGFGLMGGHMRGDMMDGPMMGNNISSPTTN